ncbi:MAG: hypothetical protein KatS3mg131_2304 [Candidatus Tectimicrobiota bacterium]|nr:MAG: hypothetical protein KatS3mg131_2304 [Candidatus Tectomicrobia bacterium]
MAREAVREAVPLDAEARQRRRHAVAAVVYFLYGIFYLFGAQYLMSMQAAARGMANPQLFFLIGAVITVLFPLLIYSRFALALSLVWPPRARRTTLYINFTLLLGLLVLARVVALLRGGLFLKTPLHTAGLLIAAFNAACLLWAGLSRPCWTAREGKGDA